MFEGLLAPTHLIILLVLALFVIGPKRLPAAGRGMGEALRGFKDGIAPGTGADAEPPAPVLTEVEAEADRR